MIKCSKLVANNCGRGNKCKNSNNCCPNWIINDYAQTLRVLVFHQQINFVRFLVTFCNLKENINCMIKWKKSFYGDIAIFAKKCLKLRPRSRFLGLGQDSIFFLFSFYCGNLRRTSLTKNLHPSLFMSYGGRVGGEGVAYSFATDGHSDLWLNRHRGRFSENKLYYKGYLSLLC